MNKYKTRKMTKFKKNQSLIVNYNIKYKDFLLNNIKQTKQIECNSLMKKYYKNNNISKGKIILKKIITERNDIKYLKNELINLKKPKIKIKKNRLRSKNLLKKLNNNEFIKNKIRKNDNITISSIYPIENKSAFKKINRHNSIKYRDSLLKNLVSKNMDSVDWDKDNKHRSFKRRINKKFCNINSDDLLKNNSYDLNKLLLLNSENEIKNKIINFKKINSLDSKNSLNNILIESMEQLKLKNKTTIEFEELNKKNKENLLNYNFDGLM